MKSGDTVNDIKMCYLRLSALSVYRGVLERSVIGGFRELLGALTAEPSEFLDKYGRFYSLLCERDVADRLAYAVTETLLFDENRFTLAATGGKTENLPENIVAAAKADCETILSLSETSSKAVLEAYKYFDEIAALIPSLPRWICGEPADEFKNGVDMKTLAEYHRINGCGIFARYRAFIWRGGEICPVVHPDSIDMDAFTGYERQRKQVVDNTVAFLEGKSCNNVLLYGDMGTGKSSTVKAIANEFRTKGLRVVEMPKERLGDFPILVDKIAALPMKFIVFIDDLSFRHQDQSYTSLKAVLEGGLAARPANALIYATSNRRHLIKESWQDRDTDDIHRRDNMQETLSLSDRFGLAVCYSVPDKREYLEIVYAMAKKAGIAMDKDELAVRAERFALGRGGRSPRCAKQFTESLLL